MKLHFDSNQEYQIEAIRAVTDLFEGQPLSGGDFEFSLTSAGALLSENGVGNKLTLTEEQVWENIKSVQQRHEIKTENKELQGMNFSVEMETGTGKTYVYLRTICELNKLYGFKKFVIVVPSVAIREGVLKNLQITHDHFQNLYDKAQISYDVYDSKKVSSFTHHVRKPEKTVYENYIPLDSSVENQFARDCESSENIEFFFKLPSWFKINTPIGTYNPDWAIVFRGEKKVYFVAETKGEDQELRPSERLKIACGKAHFKQFEDVRFKGPVSSVSELNG